MTDTLNQVRSHLNEIPVLVAEAEYYITPGSAPKDPDARHSTSVYRIPIVAEVIDLLDPRDKGQEDATNNWKYAGFERAEAEDFHINNGQRRLGVLPTLGMWVSLVYAELEDTGHDLRECCPARQHSILGECKWLSEYAEQILELHPDFPHDIAKLHRELQRVCRIRRQYTPKCPNCTNHVEGIYGNAEDQAPAWWRCTGCGKTWVHDAEVQRLALTQPKMTLRQIATWLSIPLRTLYNWRDQGRFITDKRGLAELSHVENAAKRVGRASA